jgi:hypothetical protein
VYTTSVNLEVADCDLLVQALEALGWKPSRLHSMIYVHINGRQGRIYNGVFTMAGDQAQVEGLVAQVKQAYAAQAVASAVKKFGWVTKQPGAQQLVLTRRR